MTQPEDSAPRPRPQYGEYAPPGWVSPNADALQAPPPVPPQPATPAPKSWDRPLTMVLLVVGFFGMLIGVYAGLNIDLVVQQGGLIQGTEPVLPPWSQTAGWVIVGSHVLLYAFAVTTALSRLRAGRPAFWVPLIAGVIAAIVYNAVLMAVGIESGMFGSLLG